MISIFDSDINELTAYVAKNATKVYAYDESKALPVSEHSELILTKDSAYELGGSDMPCAAATVITGNLPVENKVVLVGKELKDIKRDCNYAKIVLISVKDAPEDEQAIFDLTKSLEYAKYKENVQGFMMRASSFRQREQVRVSKTALKKGLSFEALGATTIKSYLSRDVVNAVTVIFVADTASDFEPVQNFALHTAQILSAFNHILDNVLVDCAHCNLKEICDEVEGMRELHLNLSKPRY